MWLNVRYSTFALKLTWKLTFVHVNWTFLTYSSQTLCLPIYLMLRTLFNNKCQTKSNQYLKALHTISTLRIIQEKMAKLVIFQDFLYLAKIIFRLICWDPFIDFDNSPHRVLTLRTIYLMITNFYMLSGAVLETIYCFNIVRHPDAILKITKSLPIAGKNWNNLYEKLYELLQVSPWCLYLNPLE